jgi:hypothetical protein
MGAADDVRSVTLIDGDITKPSRYPALLTRVLAEGFDVYYQRAAEKVPFAYTERFHKASFIRYLYEHMRGNGFFVTDDFAFSTWRFVMSDHKPVYVDRGPRFPVACRLVETPEFLSATEAALRQRAGLFPLDEPYYGNLMRLRRKETGKPASAVPPVSLPSDISAAKKSLMQDFTYPGPATQKNISSPSLRLGHGQEATTAVFWFLLPALSARGPD